MSSSVELETRVDGSGGTLENTKPQKKEKRRKKKKKKSKSRPQQHEPEPERVDAGDESDLEKQAPPQSTESGIMRFKKYKRRWWILFIFGALNWANAFMWISFASIGSTTAYYYDVPRSSVNWLVLIFSIAYVPGTPVASYIYMKFGLREGVLLGAGFTMVGTWIRMVSVRGMANDDQAHDSGFVWVVIGQIVASGGQPFFTNAAARIAGDWFPLRERSLATTVGALFNPLGIATAQVIPPLIVDGGERAVNDRGEDVGPIQTVTGMPNLHLATGIVATVLFVLAYLLFESSPPVPPSKSAERKRDVLQSKLEIERATPGRRRGRFYRQVMSELKTLLMNPHFLVLTFAFAGGLAIFNGLLTLIEQLIEPYGYTDDDAGMLGGVIIAAGLTSATITSFVTDKYQNYNGALKLMMWLALASSIFVGIALEPHNLTMLAVAFACLGSSTVPVLPISFQCAAEATYPINEDLSSGILNVAGNLAGLIVVPVLDLLITGEDGQCLVLRDDQTFCPHRPEDGGRLCCEYGPSFEDNNPPITFICISVAVISIITMFYNGPYLRTSQDKKFKAEAADEDDDPFLQSPITNN